MSLWDIIYDDNMPSLIYLTFCIKSVYHIIHYAVFFLNFTSSF